MSTHQRGGQDVRACCLSLTLGLYGATRAWEPRTAGILDRRGSIPVITSRYGTWLNENSDKSELTCVLLRCLTQVSSFHTYYRVVSGGRGAPLPPQGGVARARIRSTYARTHARAHKKYIHTRARTHAYTHTRIHVRARTHAYTHTRMCTHTQTRAVCPF